MKAQIVIDLQYAAFMPEANIELARILRELSNDLEYSGELRHINLIDVNGNKVGEFKVTR